MAKNYRFGVFQFDGQTGELWKDGQLIKLRPQPTRLLELLVDHAGSVVERDQIQRAIWGPDIQVDYELGVNRCIRQIRGALLDNADAPIYIQTIARRGYRFIAPVERLEHLPVNGHYAALGAEPLEVSPQSETSRPAPEAAPAHSRNLRRYWILLPVLAAVSTLFVWFQNSNRSHLPPTFEVVPLATYLGYEYSPSFSPDGQQVAFTWNGEQQNNFDIYTKVRGSSRLHRLTSNPDIDYGPAWSPDGRWIAFCRATETPGGALWLIPALGGVERKILDLRAIADPANRPISWLPDSKSLVLASPIGADSRIGLRLVDVFTGQVRQLTTPAAGEDDSYPAFSPRGNAIAFTRDSGRGFSSVYLLPFHAGASSSQQPERLDWPEFRDSAYGHTAWTPDGGSLVFESRRGGPQRLWIASATQSARPRVLASLGEESSGAAVSATGKLAYVRSNFNSNIWRIDLGGLNAGRAPMAIRTIASTRDDESPAVSPNGHKLAFASDRSGFAEIWVSNIDGSDPVQMTFLEHLAGSPAWSSDGQSILFDSREKGDAHLYSVPLNGGEPTRLFSGAGVLPLASPDGKWIYFSSRASGSLQVWRIPQSGGGPAQQLTTLGGFGAKLSPDCRFAYYTRNNAAISSLWQLDLATRQEQEIAPAVYLRAFIPDTAGVYYFSGDPHGRRSLNLFCLESRTTRQLFTAGKVDGRGIALSPDGKFLFYGELDRSNSELKLVENFWN